MRNQLTNINHFNIAQSILHNINCSFVNNYWATVYCDFSQPVRFCPMECLATSFFAVFSFGWENNCIELWYIAIIICVQPQFAEINDPEWRCRSSTATASFKLHRDIDDLLGTVESIVDGRKRKSRNKLKKLIMERKEKKCRRFMSRDVKNEANMTTSWGGL